MNRTKRTLLTGLLALGLALTPAFAAQVDVANNGNGLSFATDFAYGSFDLRVTGPQGIYLQQNDGQFFAVDAEGNALPDGEYNWELRLGPEINMDELNANRDNAAFQAQVADKLHVASGGFAIVGGIVVQGGEEFAPDRVALKAQVFTTDLIVQGSECLGVDCATTESFGFDTLRLKENNLRVHFDDTSASASFPGNDWRFTFNDSSNGGSSYFSLDDATANKSPFKVMAGAPSNALYVKADGKVGVGTASPALRLQVTDGNSPALRLEQDGSAGFASQSWDLSGNETNFFLRDVTNSSQLPFRVAPGAGDDLLSLKSNQVGIGTWSPSATLHVKPSSNTATAKIEGSTSANLEITSTTAASFDVTSSTEATFEVINSNTTTAQRQLMTLTNNGGVRFTLKNTAGTNWDIGSEDAGTFVINVPNNGSTQFRMDDAGNVTTSGTVNGTSDRNMKRHFEQVDPQEVLAKVVEMPMTTWNYKADDASIRHIGPMAQDFYAAFELGVDERHIAFSDMGGVALVAIQALENENAELKERLAKLEALVSQLAGE